MREKEPREGFSVNTLLANIESKNNITDTDRYIAESLRELYSSNAYLAAIPRDCPKEQFLIKAVRIVRRMESDNELVSIVFGGDNFERKRSQLINTILEESKRLPVTNRRMPRAQERLALNRLKETGFSTVASMAIIEGTTSGKQTIEVRYPKVFMNIDSSVPPPQSGLAIAVYFLKRVPIK